MTSQRKRRPHSAAMREAIMERALREIAMDLAVRVPIHPDAHVSDAAGWRTLTARQLAASALEEIGYWTSEEAAAESAAPGTCKVLCWDHGVGELRPCRKPLTCAAGHRQS